MSDRKAGKHVVSCPSCGRQIEDNRKGKYAYGSPFRTCEGCGNTYYDEWYREISVDGIVPEDRMILSLWKVIGALVGLVLLLFALSEWCSWFLGLSAAWIFGAIGFLVLLLFVGLNLADLTSYPAKKKQLRKMELESVARIRDPEYVRKLEAKGKYVLAKYASFAEKEDPFVKEEKDGDPILK